MLALGLVVGVGGARILAEITEPSGSASPEPSSSPAVSAVPSASGTPAATPQPLLTLVATSGLEDDDDLAAIVSTPGGFVAVGQHGTAAAVWTSTDGASWTMTTEVPSGPPADWSARLDNVAVGPAGLVSTGTVTDGFDFVTPWVWHSVDGEQWSSVWYEGSHGRMTSLTATSQGYVSVGYVSDDGYTARPQTWTSADGRAWAAGDSPAFSGGTVVTGDGRLVIVDGDEQRGLTYVSTDGLTWTAAPDQVALEGAELTSVMFAEGAFLATGRLGEPVGPTGPPPAIWRSVDGLEWTQVLLGDRGQVIHQIVAYGGELIAIGGLFPSHGWSYDPSAPNPPSDTVQVWTSPDGTTWEGPFTAYVASGGVTLGQAGVGDGLLIPVTLLNPGPDFPLSSPAILRGLP